MNLDRNLLRRLATEKPPFIRSSLFGSVGVLMLIGQAWALSGIIESLFKGSPLFLPTGLFALFSSLRIILNWAGRHAARQGAAAIREGLSRHLAETVASLGPAFTRSVESGRLATTMLRGTEAIDAWYSRFIPQLVLAIVTPAAILAVVFPADRIAGTIMVLTAPLIPLFMMLIGRSSKAATDRQWSVMNRMSGYFLDMLQGLTTLKLFAQEKARREGIREASETFRRSTMKVLRIAFLSSLTLELVSTIGTAVVAVSIGIRLASGNMPMRPALFTLVLVPDFYLTLRQLGTSFHAGMEGTSASNEMQGILDRKGSGAVPGSKTLVPAEASASPIVLDRASYAFPGSTRPALDEVSCTIPPGTVTALTGPSGSGKSTLLNMLLRFMEPDRGSVALGAIPVRDISPEAWYRCVAWVPQHPFLFNATIRENLLMAKPDASGPEVDQALRQAGLIEMVRSLPEGLDTVIGEQGSRLSGGEAQRLSLARAFLKDAPILLLDEPTSNTDPILESRLRAAMEELMKGRTVVMIAHRLESIREAGQIIVLDKGRVVQQGTHDELLACEGFYRNAVRSSTEVAA